MASVEVGLSTVHSLTADIWECIAFNALVEDCTFLGPPKGLCTLLSVSRPIYEALSFVNNSRFYARLFCFKFDYSAPLRRFSERWRTTHCLAIEFKKRTTALQRIRRRSDFRTDDLWTCYLMMLENDGRNERQLVDWAHMFHYLHEFTMSRLEPMSPIPWFDDSVATSLTLWLWWMLFWREALTVETTVTRSTLMQYLLHGPIVASYKYPSVYAPDAYFYLPLPPELEEASSSSGPLPQVSNIIHYSHNITLASPALSPAALLVWTVRWETYQDMEPFNAASFSRLPANRQVANSMGLRGATIEDVLEFRGIRIHAPERCPLVVDCQYRDEIVHSLNRERDDNLTVKQDSEDPSSSFSLLQGSSRYDEDWYRIVTCVDPWKELSPLAGIVYKLGSLVGSWAGRFLQPSFSAFTSLLINPRQDPTSVPLYTQPLYWTLHEHHCILPNIPVNAGEDDFGGEDLLHAWLPRGCTVTYLEVSDFCRLASAGPVKLNPLLNFLSPSICDREIGHQDAIEVFDPITERTSRYETYTPRNMAEAPYSRTVCEKLQYAGTCEEWDEIGGEDRDMAESAGQDGVYDGEVDTLHTRSSGVTDILITGETGEKFGDAWGHFDILGRVRPRDGLIVLLRTPRNRTQSHLGQWIFEGYIHHQNFVGQWRETSTSADVVGYGGGFVVAKSR